MTQPNNSPLELAWLRWVKANMPEEYTVIFAEELSGRDAPRPAPPFITLKIISGPRPRGFDDIRSKPAAPGFELAGHRQYTISLQAVGIGNRDALSDLHARLDDPYAAADLRAEVGIGVVDRGDITDITIALETGFERRVQMDVIFNSAKTLDTAIATIESAEVGGTIHEGAQGNQTVPPFTVGT